MFWYFMTGLACLGVVIFIIGMIMGEPENEIGSPFADE